QALEQIPLRVHQDIILNQQMLVEPRDLVLLLPARTRYEQPGGGTETTTERRILFSPEIPGRRIGESRAEWEIFTMLAQAVNPQAAAPVPTLTPAGSPVDSTPTPVSRPGPQRGLLSTALDHPFQFQDADAIRREIAAAVPAYEGIQNLTKTGDQIQWGGPRLCENIGPAGNSTQSFPTADGRARFSLIEIATDDAAQGMFSSNPRLTDDHRADASHRTLAESPIDSTGPSPSLRTPAEFPIDSTGPSPSLRTPAGSPIEGTRPNVVFRLSTRRGKQFNSMIQRDRDPLTGARRDDVLMNPEDAASLGVEDGDSLLLRSDAGEFRGRCRIAPITNGNVQAHWPEANPLIKGGLCDPECGIPDYNTLVHITRVQD
ncbi:MAG TPA: molybdopterin dinucleotide binding domain-containing protein, partial [Blastocatellia bacterium]|nr:molybdopterin dinucleotide binding domain-containing protein [Blastocatellia bacterium]